MLTKLKELFRNLAIYGLGDVVTSIVSFLLLPIYVRYLSPADYGVISLLLTVEVVSKIVFRWGVDASFMRLYFDCPDERARQRLGSTIFFFLAGVNGVFLAVAIAAAGPMGRHLFGTPEYTTVLRLVLINTFVVGFYFLPFHVLRINKQSPQFIALTFARSAATLAARLVFVVFLGRGVMGVVLADLVVTLGFTILLVRWFAPLIRPMFSMTLLREALHFGLPRIPHGVAHQVIAIADRYLLSRFVTMQELGVYSTGASFGLALKLFLSAFEYAWAPFYFAAMKEPDARATFTGVTTYAVAVLVLLVAGLSAVAFDLVRLMTPPAFHGAAAVIPWIALGVMLQGIYLLTSIGLNITKRTGYYPVATAAAAACSVTANLLLIPRFGALGAAWANALSYGVLAGVSMCFSQRLYPIPYEWARLARIAVSGAVAYGLALGCIPRGWPALPALLARGAIVLGAYPACLFVLRFFDERELRVLERVRTVWRKRRAAIAASDGEPMAPAGDTVELAGEIVAAGTTEERR